MNIDYEAALLELLADPDHRQLMVDSYISLDPLEAAGRFFVSAEWAAIARLLGPRIEDATVLDLGAGNGIASWAFARAGAATVYALEPHPGALAGRAAIATLSEPRVVPLDASGEAIPLGEGAVDIVYARQVLHHVKELGRTLAECNRVLKPGGMALFTREHVVDSPEQLQEFLASHPVHQLAGGEHAHPLRAYLNAIRGAHLRILAVLGPLDSIINAYPLARTQAEVATVIRDLYVRRFGRPGSIIARWPGASAAARRQAAWRGDPGRLFSFVTVKAG